MKRVAILAIGSFALGLDAYVIAGILPVIGKNLEVSESAAGQMITVFTLAYALLSPAAATWAASRPVRPVLLTALTVFVLGNVLSAVAPSLPLLLVSRAVAGLGAGLYAPVAAAAAAAMAGPQVRGRALAMIVGGMSIGTAIGVPLGLVLAHHLGWRSTMWLVVGIGVIAIGGVLTLPAIETAAAPSLRRRLAVMADRRVLAIVLVTVCASGTSIGMYTYTAPLLAETLHSSSLSSYLWLWGVGGLLGSLVLGRVLDRWRNTRALVSLILGVQGLVLISLPETTTAVVGTAIALVLWGAAGWGVLAPQQHRLLAIEGGPGPVAVSLNASALYLGSALGAAVGGLLLSSGNAATTLAITFGAVALVAAAANVGFGLRTGVTATPQRETVSV